MKHFGSEVFRLGAILDAFHDVRVHPLKIELIEIAKAGGILLCSFYQKPLVRFFLQSLQRILRGSCRSPGITGDSKEGYGTFSFL